MYILCLCLLAVSGSILGARILAIVPTASISHQLPFQAVMKALATRGHQVTVISTDPLKNPHPNYTDISLSFTYEMIKQSNFANIANRSPYQMVTLMTELSFVSVKLQLQSKVMQDFIKAKPEFDLVVHECLVTQAFYGLIHLVGSPPVVGMLSLGEMIQGSDIMGNSNNPAYDPNMMLPFGDHMNFWERCNNLIFSIFYRYNWYWRVIPAQEALMRKVFGKSPPSILETERNYSLFMVNNHWSLNYPRPLLPNYVELGSLHVQQKPNPLPKDLKEFLDGAQDGFIYFSLGSNVRSDKLPEDKRRAFLDAFAELPQRVLWKWESDTLPGQPGNVKLGKWLPQQDILAHPNIRLFVTQGGLQSFQEATHHAVPLVGIPFISDQAHNIHKIVNVGVGLKLDIMTATKETILRTFQTVINDPKFRENMQKLSALNRDQPETSMDRAIWWIEYVLRHNGAKHLRSAALDLTWYQYLLLDVIAFGLVTILVTLVVIYFIAKKLRFFLINHINHKSKLA